MLSKVVSTQVQSSDISEDIFNEIESDSYFSDLLISPATDIKLPNELSDFLNQKESSYWYFVYKKGFKGIKGPDYVKTATIDTLKLIDIVVGINAEKKLGYGVNLITGATDYCFPGLLVYLPESKLFGTYDPDHMTLTVFKNTSWSDIIQNIGAYIVTQWHKPKKNSFWHDIKTSNAFNKFIKNKQ